LVADRHWFEDIADHAGRAYLRYSFTKGTSQEVGFLVDTLGLRPGMRVLDVGCGPGRHCHELAKRGMSVVGIDRSSRFVALAAGGAGCFVRGDARTLPLPDASFDAVISLCQGGFGLLGGDEDALALAEMLRVLRARGRVALSAFSAYFQLRWLEETDSFDAASGVNHERSVVKDESGREETFDLWTTCFTPRELRLLTGAAGGVVEQLWSVTPGDYAQRAPDLDHPEWLAVLRRR
jgi:ubiquinone/menaquinone biosynthesis C-methylase UbiE